MEIGGIDEETANDQNGLVVRLRRIGQRSEVSRLSMKQTFIRARKVAMATRWWP